MGACSGSAGYAEAETLPAARDRRASRRRDRRAPGRSAVGEGRPRRARRKSGSRSSRRRPTTRCCSKRFAGSRAEAGFTHARSRSRARACRDARRVRDARLRLRHVRCASPSPRSAREGRLSARRGGEAVAVHFDWRHSTAARRVRRRDAARPDGRAHAARRGRRCASSGRTKRPSSIATGPRSCTRCSVPPFRSTASRTGCRRCPIRAAPPTSSATTRAVRSCCASRAGRSCTRTATAPSRPSRLVMRYPGSDPVEVRIVVDRSARHERPKRERGSSDARSFPRRRRSTCSCT